MQKQASNYKIRQVIDLTGASEFLLRVWELRYAALNPVRTKTGRRLYTESDILKVRALLALTQQGYRIGDIAQKSLRELNQMQEKKLIAETDDNLNFRVQKIMTASMAFEWEKARELIRKKNQKGGSALNWLHEIVVPLLIEMGQQVDAGNFSIAQEHILSAIIKESLGRHFHPKKPSKHGPRIILAAPEGDFHDIGLLIAYHIASELKANVLFLGPHMPKEELASVCVRYKATHLLLSSTNQIRSGKRNDYFEYLHFLDRNLDSKITLWLAGRNTQNDSIWLKRPLKKIDSFLTFEHEVRKCFK